MSTQDAGRFRCPSAVAAGAFLLASLLAAGAAAAPQDAPPTGEPAAPAEVDPGQQGPTSVPLLSSDLERAQATMGRLLTVGRALHAWVRDTRLERGRKAPTAEAPTELRWDRCPLIGHGELVELLVPAYVRELPEEDAWGRPLQFCLDRRLSAAHQQYGVRSPGSDGMFSGDGYQVGGFPESRLEGDLVWMDGSFVRWAQPQ